MRQLAFITIFMLAGLCVFAQHGVIERIAGTVEIKQPGESSFKNASSGDTLYKETVIATGFKSLAVIKIGSTTITARPLTHLTLTEIQALSEAETVNINLQAGRIRVDVKPSVGTKARMTVNSPTATASVRGTRTLTEIQALSEAETVNINLQAGRIRVDVKPPVGTKARTTINSPTATASVRGTSFEFDTDNLFVNEGTVSFNGSRGQNILVSAGGTSRVGQTGQVTIPRDERNASLLPPSPIGTNAEDAPVPGSAPTEVYFSINMEFE